MALSAWQVNSCRRLKTSAHLGIGYKTDQVGKNKRWFLPSFERQELQRANGRKEGPDEAHRQRAQGESGHLLRGRLSCSSG